MCTLLNSINVKFILLFHMIQTQYFNKFVVCISETHVTLYDLTVSKSVELASISSHKFARPHRHRLQEIKGQRYSVLQWLNDYTKFGKNLSLI